MTTPHATPVLRARPLLLADAWRLDLVALRLGEPDALADCYRAHAPQLIALAYRLTASTQDAEDVVHDVFVGLPEALVRYEERGEFAGWLARVTTRLALVHRRRERRRRTVQLDGIAVATPSVEADPIAHDRAMRALSQLTPALRHVFVLRVIEEYSHADVAALLGITVNNSEVRLHRAVQQLRALLRSIA